MMLKKEKIIKILNFKNNNVIILQIKNAESVLNIIKVSMIFDQNPSDEEETI